jgi:hypothetical protein
LFPEKYNKDFSSTKKKYNKDPFGLGPISDQLLLLLDQGMEILKPCGPLLWLVKNGGKLILPL